MRFSKFIVILLLLGIWANAAAQGSYAHLRSWEGKYPTYNREHRNFFNLPEIQRPLRRLLSQHDYYMLTRGHTKEGPIEIVDNYLRVFMCGSPRSYACDHITLFIIDLNDGSMYAAFDIISDAPRYYSTKGKFTDLPERVRGWRYTERD
ncbi:MAG: hypothetical protein AUG51_24540 [Acidobacteria bacterium 13_1_20CM_3_53_8]|nr:MAG: hypothetical protein AUG51_24540 [Acidobacteria bacterium 13_1_20CM_3_53_8]